MGDKTLVRFDWAMKRLLRNKANFAVLEGFLSELFREDIKIHKILESEANKNFPENKINRVDLLAENSKGELIIIEVQNQNELDYFHRMAFGTSKAVTEYLDEGQAYEEMKKIYSVNIVYFDLGQGEDYIYKGGTDFWGLHKNDKLKLSERQQYRYKTTEPHHVFPEYYLLKVNQFDDLAKDTLDEWMYYFKHNEIKKEFQAKGLKQARKMLTYDKLSKGEQIDYRHHMEDLRYKASIISTLKSEEEFDIHKKGVLEGKAEGIIEGKAQGATERTTEMVKNMHAQQIPLATIVKVSGLSDDEVIKIIEKE